MSLYFALPGALSYGLADFAGGLATRRAPVFVVTAVVQVAGLVALLPAMPIAGGTLSWAAVGWGVLAAAGGTGGLLLYLRALAVGPMGVVAPLSAVVGAGLPLLVGLLSGERLGPVTLVAIGIALVAIVLATAGGKAGTGGRIGPLMALGAGAGFALFFVGLHAAPTDSGMWPLLVGRLASVPALVVGGRADRRPAPGCGVPVAARRVLRRVRHARQRVLPARHPLRRPGRERGGRVALPGGGRAARRAWCCGSGSPRCRSAGRASRWARACCWRSGVRRASSAATAARPTCPA